MGFLNNSHDKANISPDILQLLPNAFPYSFGGTLLRFGKLQIIPVGCPAPHPGLFQLVGFAVHINDVLQLFPCFIQKLEILRIGNVSRTAGGIHDEGALVLTGAAAVLIVVIVLDLPWGRKLPAARQWLPAGSASGILPWWMRRRGICWCILSDRESIADTDSR